MSMFFKYSEINRKFIGRLFGITTLGLSCCMSGCEKFIDTPVPANQLATSSVFSNDATATAAMSGVYEQMMESLSSYSNGMLTLYAGLSGDELLNLSSATTKVEFSNNNITAANTELKNNIWDRLYKNVYQANAVLAGIEGNKMLSSAVISQLEGEARFMRAFCHFYLTNFFGNVPYIVSTDYRVNAVAKQLDREQLYHALIDDLLRAQALLGNGEPGRLRPDKLAATAMLARVYLYNANYEAAFTQASLVIASGDYQLENDLNEIFKANSREAIWRLKPVLSTTNVGDGYLFVQTTGVPTYAVISDSLLAAMEQGDKRKGAWVNSYTFSARQYSLPFKYKVKSAPTVTEFNTVLRLAEIYLIRAEANAQQGDLIAGLADLNMIRSRSGLPAFNPEVITKQRLLEAIAQERRIELFAEWGHRWMDLKRTGKVNQVMGALRPASWQNTDGLYPIPRAELLNNPQLIQNPGYN